MTQKSQKKLDLNSATVDEIQAVPMVGIEKAQAIVAYREQRGSFENFLELKHVPGFSAKLIESMDLFFTIGGEEPDEQDEEEKGQGKGELGTSSEKQEGTKKRRKPE